MGRVRKQPVEEPKPIVTLVTNLKFVQAEPFRLDCSALIVEENIDGIFDHKLYTRIRGFGPDGAWPVFTQWLKKEQLPVEFVGGVSDQSKLMMGEDGNTTPLFSGSMLKLGDGTSYFLQAEDGTRPLDIIHNLEDYDLIWRILERKAAEYWRAPYMPSLRWGPPMREGLRRY